jgi:hypothetical protein
VENMFTIDPPPRLEHRRDLEPHAEEDASQVELDHSIEVLHVELRQRDGHGAAAGVVERRVQVTERSHRLLDQVLDRSGVTDVGGDGEGVTAGFSDVLRERVESLFVPSGEHDGCSSLSEQPGGRRSDPAASPRDDRYGSIELALAGRGEPVVSIRWLVHVGPPVWDVAL